ncbi:MAG: TIGR04283 family arsenosugar biosynthesis glycosyltransferase [Desulfobacterales bacterium]
MPDSRERLILFTRYPEPGTAKTRLIPVLGPEGAAAFQMRMSRHALECAGRLSAERGASIEIRHEGGSADRMRAWLGSPHAYRPQGPGSLGRRMAHSLAQAFDSGAERAVIIGSDIPGITVADLARAFDALHGNDLVFGPASDGGYYAIGATSTGFRRGSPYLDEQISWGTARVLAQSIEAARAQGFRWALLDVRDDVDRPQDLPAAMKILSEAAGPPRLSVIIPALNEAEQIGATLSSLPAAPAVEVVVVDGGSRDGTPAIAESWQARVLRAHPPRSIQMNAGAALASGACLVFLHADTRLPPNLASAITATLARPKTGAGAFHLRIDSHHPGLKLIGRAANWRSRWLRMPYGDQGIFMQRDLFWTLGGFAPLAIMEDFEMIRRLKKRTCIRLAPGWAVTSARRWQRHGIFTTWLCNQWMIAAFCLGASTDRLARWYRFKG